MKPIGLTPDAPDAPDAPDEEQAPLWAALGALGDPRGDGVELTDVEMLQRVLEDASREIAEPVPPRRLRPGMRRGVAVMFAAAVLAACLFGALAAELVREWKTAPPRPLDSAALAPPGASAARPSSPLASPPAPASLPAPPADPASPPSPPDPADSARAPAGDLPTAARPAEPPASADALLQRAQTELRAGRTRDAVSAYQALVARYPSSPEAQAALFSLGQVSLSGGNAAAALAYFDRYLAGRGGALGMEARYGRIQSLRRLGRAGEERAAIDDFLGRYGDSAYAAGLRARLEAAPSGD